eukprot:959289-Rhodomonas_salina.3
MSRVAPRLSELLTNMYLTPASSSCPPADAPHVTHRTQHAPHARRQTGKHTRTDTDRHGKTRTQTQTQI